MICRRMENGELVFFGSSGRREDGSAQFIDTKRIGAKDENGTYLGEVTALSENGYKSISVGDSKSKSYASGLEGVRQSLYQRLSLIQGELPHFTNAGFPITNKDANKQMLDSYIINVVLHHPAVISIKTLNSRLDKHNYIANIEIITQYGELMFTQNQII